MLADQRKQIILDQVNLNHSVTVARLVELLGVSTETVRRDLEDLEITTCSRGYTAVRFL